MLQEMLLHVVLSLVITIYHRFACGCVNIVGRIILHCRNLVIIESDLPYSIQSNQQDLKTVNFLIRFIGLGNENNIVNRNFLPASITHYSIRPRILRGSVWRVIKENNLSKFQAPTDVKGTFPRAFRYCLPQPNES